MCLCVGGCECVCVCVGLDKEKVNGQSLSAVASKGFLLSLAVAVIWCGVLVDSGVYWSLYCVCVSLCVCLCV